MFQTFLPVARWRGGPRIEAVVGLLSVVFIAALLALVVVGPFVISGLTGLSFVAALQRVVVVAGAAYVVGMALLLR